jgi:putative ABC transport system permease protein
MPLRRAGVASAGALVAVLLVALSPGLSSFAAVIGIGIAGIALKRSHQGALRRPPRCQHRVSSSHTRPIGPGVAAIDRTQVTRLHAGQGGTIAVSTPDGGTERLRVAAVYRSGGGVLPDVLLSMPDFTRGFRPAGAGLVLINGASGVSAAASPTAVDTAVASDPLVTVHTLADYRAELANAVNGLIALFSILMGLALLIALFGISNTLTLSVLERTRESALMRALGLTRGQLRRMLLTEALYMALIAAVLGVGLGAAFAWTLVNSFLKHNGGGVISIPFAEIGLFVVVGALAALLAGVLPARRAARVSPVNAMADVG